jgi:hypothetical protein
MRERNGKLARLERFELPTFWFVARHSIQLSYRRVDVKLLRTRATTRRRHLEAGIWPIRRVTRVSK